ncbi:threonine synthase [Flavisolibacter ginsenosidimutans]|uniref:Threonine synthase n=1 Tax=Flavisolibacter ginsenosidimutans TaxID=661481 RepID=A0A5B8UHL2_9BACT|nr:threonine synthase [Flavisolibacter ginsenosidimutans]QEC55912.1 threonine synthase [Flavisolibacter ginsenosidimutans]
MQYFSTNNKTIKADFRQATVQGQPSDKGLYFPERIPQLPEDFIKNINNYSKEEIAFEVIKPYVGNTIDDASLKKIVDETVFFDFPLVKISDSISALELFHGPTLAFKDVGARFMSRCLSHFAKDEKRRITVLVATSGDTGGAVADAFYGVENVDVVILYPSGKVSDVQELQLTTLGKNITALEVEGSFDDCQRMVKDAFADKRLNEQLYLTSANSINVARWLPQQFYYFYAYQQWQNEAAPVISVPSGNFGNICAGLMAYSSGLPVQHFVAACNANDVIPQYLASGNYQTKQAVYTLSNAMDVANPSNFVRILEIFNHQLPSLKNAISSYSISDEETVAAIKEVRSNYDYLLDPHGAVGYVALRRYLNEHAEQKGYLLETAHPVKFNTEEFTGYKVEVPSSIQHLLKKEKKSTRMKADGNELKSFLLGEKSLV